MAIDIDFSNKDSNDPAAVYSLDTRNTQPAWVNDDWSVVETDQAAARKKGANNQVKLATVTLNDGRQFDVILGADGQPISPVGDSTGQDKDVANRWKQQQHAAAPPGGATTRTINGQVMAWNPATRAYDTPTGQTPASTAQAAAPGGKAFVDDGPDARENGRRWGWNPDTKLYDRDLGPSPTAQEIIRNRSLPADQDPRAETDAERAARAKETIARQEREAQQNRPTIATVTINGQRYTTQTTPGANGGLPAIQHFGPDGKPIDKLPIEIKPGTRIPGGGEHGEDVQAVVGPDGSISYQPIAGAQVPEKNRPIPRGAPRYAPDPTDPSGDFGLTAFDNQVRDAHEKGVLSYEQARQLVADAVESAQVAERSYNNAQTRASTNRSQDLTQRGQDIGEVASRRSAADTGFDGLFSNINSNAAHLGRGNGGLAADAFRQALALRQGYATQAGGYQDVPGTQVSPALQAIRTGASTTIHPDGTVQISHAPSEAPAPADATSNAIGVGSVGTVPAPGTNQPVNPAAGEPGNNPNAPVGMARPAYLGAGPSTAPPPFDPAQSQTVARLKAEGWPQSDIDQLIDEHNRDWQAA